MLGSHCLAIYSFCQRADLSKEHRVTHRCTEEEEDADKRDVRHGDDGCQDEGSYTVAPWQKSEVR